MRTGIHHCQAIDILPKAPRIDDMTQTEQYIFDTDEASFDRDVIQNSFEHLMLVDFWAAWCSPCRSLTPILDKLLVKYSGSVRLVKVNTDEQQQLAARYGVRSLPTVFLFKNGEVVDQFMGVQPGSVIQQLIDKHVDRESDNQLQQARDLHGAGNVDEAIALLLKVVSDDPENDRPKYVLVDWLAERSRFTEAKTVLVWVASDAKHDDSRYPSLLARIEFGMETDTTLSLDKLAQSVADNGADLEARFQLAGRLVQDEKLAEALDQLIEIIKRDRTFRQDKPRKTILKIFDLAGGKGELVNQYRRQLAQALN
jgi:putative thioredoxin